jgi:hypothetical protein
MVTSGVRVAPDLLPYAYKLPTSPKGFLTQQ